MDLRSGNYFSFLVPEGWRQDHSRDETNKWLFSGREQPEHVWVECFYQKDADPQGEVTLKPAAPYSIERSIPEQIEGYDWNRTTWTLIFTNNETRMMARFVLQEPATSGRSALQEVFAESLPLSRMQTPNG